MNRIAKAASMNFLRWNVSIANANGRTMYEKCNTIYGTIALPFFDTKSALLQISGDLILERKKRFFSEVQTLCGFAEKTRVIDLNIDYKEG